MILVEIIEYLFSFFYRKYLKWDKDVPGVYALGIITILQFLNISVVALLLILFNAITIDNISNSAVVVIILLLLIVNYWYIYKKRGREQILVRYSRDTIEIKKVKKLSFLYIIVTLFLFVILFVYAISTRHH
jgi:hypothetical protein